MYLKEPESFNTPVEFVRCDEKVNTMSITMQYLRHTMEVKMEPAVPKNPNPGHTKSSVSPCVFNLSKLRRFAQKSFTESRHTSEF